MSTEQQEMAPPQPTKEHENLAKNVGVWDVDCTFYMDPSQPPMEVKATDTVEMFGPFWSQATFECEMFGAPFRGRASLGYNTYTEQYESTWMDSMSPTLFVLRGKYDASGKVLEMSGRAFDCMIKQETNYRTTEETISADERHFEMFMEMPDGNEMKLFTHRYRRRK